jgi:multidrug resistance efflux pump
MKGSPMSNELKKVEARIKALEKKDKEYDIKIANNTQELESLDKWLKANILNVSKPYYQSQESRRSDYAEENRQWNEHKKLFQKGLEEAKAEQAKITAKAVRSEMSAIVLEMNKQCKKGARTILSASKHIKNLGSLRKLFSPKKMKLLIGRLMFFITKNPVRLHCTLPSAALPKSLVWIHELQ